MKLQPCSSLVALMGFALVVSCGGSEGSPTGTGGGTGSAGTSGTAGTTGSAGTTGAAGTTGNAGTTGIAGTTGNAGTTGSAGTTGVAGTTGNAGTTGTGGRGGATGAAGSTGGRGGGGPAGRGGSAGGAAGRGGTGAGAGGSGGSTTGTGGSTGGTTGTGGAAPSSGCGKAPPASARYTIDVGGMMREYILSVPSNYNQTTPYRLIFGWHPWGGSAMQVAGNGNSGYYGLKGASNNQAILVSPEGLPFGDMGSLGWGNTNGQDIAFLRAMLERFKSEMCIDESRIFSTGFSFGGMMSNAVACAGLARAVAPMAGNASVAGCLSGTTRVAYMGFHGVDDTTVTIGGGRMARDTIVQRNGCTQTTMPTQPSWCDGLASQYMPCSCVTYQGCTAGYPVTWCEYKAGHMAAPTSAATLWTFFSQF